MTTPPTAPPVASAPSLSVRAAGLEFAVPVLAAPGPLGFGREVQGVVDLRCFGGFITKSVTVEPRAGYPGPDVVEVEGGWLNAVGLRNPGLAGFVHRDLPFLRTLGIPIIASVAGHTVEAYQQLVEILAEEEGVAAIELNVSCPNMHAGRLFGSDPALVAGLVRRLRPMTPRPLLVKLAPLVADIAEIARAAAGEGADAFCCVNTTPGLAVDVEAGRARLGAGAGGLSGPALRPLALWSAWRVVQATHLPVIGVGGVRTAADALEFLLVGARAVAVASALITDLEAPQKIVDGLRAYLQRRGRRDVNEIIGSAEGLEGPEDNGA